LNKDISEWMPLNTSKVTDRTKNLLWARSGGRCQFHGCNIDLTKNIIYKSDVNKGYIAHILPQGNKGPRHEEKVNDFKYDIHNLENLMLLCDQCHRFIDKEKPLEFPSTRLLTMKQQHEDKVRKLLQYNDYNDTRLVFYSTNIGAEIDREPTEDEANRAVIASKYISQGDVIKLGRGRSFSFDINKNFFEEEKEYLYNSFTHKITNLLSNKPDTHFSIFGLADIPLLTYLGWLFSDIQGAEFYPRHRDTNSWSWPIENYEQVPFIVTKPSEEKKSKVAINLSISADIDSNRIEKVDSDFNIWKLTIENPSTNAIKHSMQVSLFKTKWQQMLDDINAKYGLDTEVHVFAAVSPAIAFAMGKAWMPKIHPKLKLYDLKNKEFVFALSIENKGDIV